MGRADFLRLGDWNACCDRCGRKRKGSELKKTWNGLYVCPEHWEPRHPQDFVKAVREDPTPPFVRKCSGIRLGDRAVTPGAGELVLGSGGSPTVVETQAFRTGLYFPFEDGNGSATATDQGPWGQTITLGGTAAVTNSSAAQGSMSLFCNEWTCSGMENVASPTLYSAADEWITVGFYLNISVPRTNGSYSPAIFAYNGQGPNNVFGIQQISYYESFSNPFAAAIIVTASAYVFSETVLMTSGWQHWEFSYGPTQGLLYRDGQLVHTGTHPAKTSSSVLGTTFTLFGNQANSYRSIFADDFYVVIGKSPLHSSDFTPAPFVPF